MLYLVFANLADGTWGPQVLNESSGTFAAAPQEFFYSPIYRINDVDYINESYIQDDLVYSRVLSINSFNPAVSLGTTQYYQLGEVVQYAPSPNPPQIQFVHQSAAYDPYIFYNWLIGCSPEYIYMLDIWQWNWLHDQLLLQQNLEIQQRRALKSMRYKAEASEKKLAEVLYKVEELQEILEKTTAKAKKAPKAKKSDDKRATAIAKQRQERQNLVMHAIAQFNVLNLTPDSAPKIYNLFENLNIKVDEEANVVKALDINIKECNMYILAFHRQKINNSVKICFLKKLATYSDTEHATYFVEDPNVGPKIIKAIQDIKTNDPIKAELLKKYTTLQSEAAKKYDETVLKPQRDIEKAINELDFEVYQTLAKDSEKLQKHAAALFVKALKTYSKAAYKFSHVAAEDTDFYAVVIKFVAEFDVNIEEILKNNYCPQIKLAVLHKLAAMQKTASPQEFFKLDHEFELGVLGLYEQNCDAAKIQDPDLKEKLQELQIITAEFYDLQFKQTLAILEGQSSGKIDASLLPLFAKRANDKQQTVLMLAIKHGYAYKALKPIFEAAGDTIFARDNFGLTVLHYLARYYQGTDLSFLNKFSKRDDIICACESQTDDTYLHHLLRYKKQDLIIKFIEALQDSTKVVFVENANGENVTNLLDDKETEYHEVRKAIHDLIIKNFRVETIDSDSKIVVAPEIFSRQPSKKLTDHVKNNPKRLIEMFNAWSSLINSIEERFDKRLKAKYTHPGNLYAYQGQSLHWHLTETLLDNKWQNLEQDYLDSTYYKNCHDITVTDTLVFKQLVAINYDQIAANPIAKPKRPSPSELALEKLLTFFQYSAHATKYSQFLKAVLVQPKLVMPLAMLFIKTLTKPFHVLENLAAAIAAELFVPENMELINKFADCLPEEFRDRIVVSELANLYLGKPDCRTKDKYFAPNYQALSTLVANNTSEAAQTQLMICIDEASKNIGGIGGIIHEFTKAECPELVSFILNHIKTDPDYARVALYLTKTSPSINSYQTVFKYVDNMNNAENKNKFISKLISCAAIDNNVPLLQAAALEKTLYRISIATMVNTASYATEPYTGIIFLFHEMFRNISGETITNQSKILKELYLGLADLGNEKTKLFMAALNENIENAELKIAKEAFANIQALDESISRAGLPSMSMLTAATRKPSVAATSDATQQHPRRFSLFKKTKPA